ncbi:MAG: DNA-3-methyladenine glycosylase I [Fimbriimonadaceae bacterium]
MTVKRCEWARNELAIRYHDEEWGVPVHDDQKLFEFIVLEGAQAGLSWDTILGRREGYRRAFDGFDPAKVALYGDGKVQELLADPGIIRNRAKVASAIKNAQAFLKIQEEFGSFDAYQWGFVDGVPKVNKWKLLDEIPSSTDLSDAFSKDLKIKGFSFVGTTIMYAHMQAVGMVNDHLTSCFRWREVQ